MQDVEHCSHETESPAWLSLPHANALQASLSSASSAAMLSCNISNNGVMLTLLSWGTRFIFDVKAQRSSIGISPTVVLWQTIQLGLHGHTLPDRRSWLLAAYLKLHALPHDLLHLLCRGLHKQDPGAYVFLKQTLKLGMLCRKLHLQ